MAEKRVQRRPAAILAAEVVGYSRLMGADEAGTRAFNAHLHELCNYGDSNRNYSSFFPRASIFRNGVSRNGVRVVY